MVRCTALVGVTVERDKAAPQPHPERTEGTAQSERRACVYS